ncbi:MAG TPA: 3-hydroxyacyl-CoA dehydrogenase NAD-binding domain-containing protein [Ignavibacteria bacterium]|jgi:3-hydroxybutyryl-CoA dehydrogenase
MSDIKTIGIIGAGTMGSGIASSAAISGFKTFIYDVNSGAVMNAIHKIVHGYDILFEKGKINDEKRKLASGKLTGVNRLEEFSECDFVIEAAIEDMKLKKELFQKLGKITRADTILATNTSSLSITVISTALEANRERIVGMHFFNPANIMKLVEVVRGEFTSDDVVRKTVSLSKLLSKTPVICKDTPAFIVNRVARAFYGEALKIHAEESLPIELIDRIIKEEGGFAMGPFELMDLIGIDVNLSVTKSVYEAFFYDQKYKTSPIQQKMVDAGLLGRKTKQGFYKY